MTRCFAWLLLSLMIATPAAAEPNNGGGGATTVDCKEKCQKHCMGNDTPTERANCLAREKCEDRAACPVTAPTTGTKSNPGDSGGKPKTYVPKANTGGVMKQ